MAEIRQVTGGMEGDRPTTHLTYLAEPTATEPAGFHPDAVLVSELARYADGWPTDDRTEYRR